MGANLTILSRKQNHPNPFLVLRLNLARLQDYYCNFRAVCSTFTIDIDQVNDIFPKALFEKSLHIFANGDGLIDALELFACLGVFCEDSFEDKAKFLFDIFDFNDLNKLSPIDFEFLLVCVVSSTFKVLAVNKPLLRHDITKLVRAHFGKHRFINVSQILSFAIDCPDVGEFFQLIRRIPPLRNALTANESVLYSENKDSQIPVSLRREKFRVNKFFTKEDDPTSLGNQFVFSQMTRSKNEVISSVLKKVKMDEIQRFAVTTTSLHLEWVFGFPLFGFLRPFAFWQGSHRGEHKVVYAIENLVVLFCYNLNQQMFYREHAGLVTAVCISNDRRLCASAAQGEQPQVHLWDPRTLRNAGVFRVAANCKIYSLEFLNNDSFLVCLSQRYNTPITVFDVQQGRLVLSTFAPDFLLALNPIISMNGSPPDMDNFFKGRSSGQSIRPHLDMVTADNIQASFVFCSAHEVYFAGFDSSSGVYSVRSLNFGASFPEEVVTGCLGIFKNRNNPELSVYGLVDEFELVVFSATRSGKLVQSTLHQTTGEAVHEVVHVAQNPLTHLVFFRERFLLLGFNSSLFQIFDFHIRKVVFQVDLIDLKSKSENLAITSLVPGTGYSVWVSTAAGRLVKAKIPAAALLDFLSINQPVKLRTFVLVSPLPEKLTCLCLVERPPDSSDRFPDNFVYVACKSGKINGFSIKSHALVDSFSLEDEVTAMDSFVSLEQNVVFALGLRNGRVHIRYDWELYFKSFNCRDKITCIRFSKNGMFLVVGSLQGIVYIFNQTEGTIFEVGPREVSMGDEVPLSLDFSHDQKCFIVGTNRLRFYEVTVEGKRSELISENSKIQMPFLNLRYAYANESKTLACLYDSVFGMMFMGERQGAISLFASASALNENCGSYFFGHTNRVVDLALTADKRYLFSASAGQGSLFQWKVKSEYQHHEGSMTVASTQSGTLSGNCPTITRPIVVCTNVFPRQEPSEESFVYFRGFSNQFLRKIFGEGPAPVHSNDPLFQRFPNCSLVLEHVYGFEAYDLRDSILYIPSHLVAVTPEKTDSLDAEFVSKTAPYRFIHDQPPFENVLPVTGRQAMPPRGSSRGRASAHQIVHDRNSSIGIPRLTIVETPTRVEEPSTHSLNPSHGSSLAYDEQFNRFSSAALEPPKADTVHSQSSVREFYLNKKLARSANSRPTEPPTSQRPGASQASLTRLNSQAKPPFSADRRLVVYIVSRVAVVISPDKPSKQQFYQNHSSKISTICCHFSFRLVATAEATPNPQIHVWDPLTLQQTARLATNHRLGVSLLKFSPRFPLIFSVSVDSLNSIQITNWRTRVVEGFRNTSRRQIICLDIDHVDSSRFVTGSRGWVNFWCFNGHSITEIKSLDLTSVIGDHYVTTLICFNYFLGQNIKSDVGFASSNGALGILSNYKCVKSSFLTEGKVISVLKWVEMNGRLFGFSGGSDRVVRVVDMRLREIQVIEMPGFPRGSQTMGINSLDVCVEEGQVFLLAGLNIGKIVEATLSLTMAPGASSQTFGVSFETITSSHACHNYQGAEREYTYLFKKKVMIAAHPTHFIFVSVGSDKMLQIIDFENHVLLEELSLTTYLSAKEDSHCVPTCIKFSRKGESLIIGFEDSSLLVLRLEVVRSVGINGTSHKAVISKNGRIIRDEKISTAVINVEFSPKGSYLAISFDNKRVSLEEAQENVEKFGAVIAIYEVRESEGEASGQEVVYQKRRELRLASLNAPEVSKMSIFGNANYFMSFSEDELFLIVYYQNINNHLIRENRDREGRYMVWNHETAATEMNWEILKNVRFRNKNFPNHFHGVRVFSGRQTLPSDALRESNFVAQGSELEERTIVLSAVNGRSDSVIFMGSQLGEIFIAKNSVCLSPVEQNPDRLKLGELCQCKKFLGHTSFVNQIEFDGKESTLLTTAVSDECVMQWRVSTVDPQFELDHKQIDLSVPDDIYLEVVPKQDFETVYSDIYRRRNNYSEILTDVDWSVFPKYRLELSRIIGRRAKDRRGNLWVSANNQLVYAAGTMVVLLDLAKRKTFQGQVTKKSLAREGPGSLYRSRSPRGSGNDSKNMMGNQGVSRMSSLEKMEASFSSDDQDASKSVSKESQVVSEEVFTQDFFTAEENNCIKAPGEISCLELASDQRLLCVGLSDAVGALCFWDVPSRSYLGRVQIDKSVTVHSVRFSDDCQNLCCFSLSKTYHLAVHFVNVPDRQVTAFLTLTHSLPYKIKASSFILGSNCQFVTVGLNHASRWQCTGNVLSFRELKYEEPYDSMKAYRREEIEQRNSDGLPGFLCILFLRPHIFVTSCMRGFVYGWLNDELAVQRWCFPDSPITVMAKSPRSDSDFIVGGFGKPLVFYRLFQSTESVIRLTSMFFVDLFAGDSPQPHLFEFQLQSLVWVEDGYVVYGTRTGGIREVFFDEKRLVGFNGQENQPYLNDDLSSLAKDSQIGRFNRQIYEFFDDEVPRSVDFAKDGANILLLTERGTFVAFDSKSLRILKILRFNKPANSMLVLSDMVILVFEQSVLALETDGNFERLDHYDRETLQPINKARTNPFQDMLALAYYAHSDYPPGVEVFKIDDALVKFFYIISDEIHLMDFSVNNVYLMYQELSGKTYVLNVTLSKLEVQTMDSDDPIEWVSDGFHLKEKRKFIAQSYEDENDIVSILKIGPGAVAVSDELGSVG